MVLVLGCSQGTTSPTTTVLSPAMTVLIVNGYTIEPGANLKGAQLTEADLQYANLSGADLTGAALAGATMPDGTKYPW